MKMIISHPTGNANSRAAVLSLAEKDLVYEFHTSIASFPGDLLDRLKSLPTFNELGRRSFDPLLQAVTKSSPFIEVARLLSLKAKLTSFTKHETGVFSIDKVYRHIDKVVASRLKTIYKKGVGKVYAYEDGALHSFRKAKQLGMQCLYDLPIAYWRTGRRLMENERNTWPDWTPTLTGFMDSAEKLANKDEELQLADTIFVASSFTANSLQDYPGKLSKIEVIPYGFPPVTAVKEYTNLSASQPLKLLFVGGLSQRKGIANLFTAVNAIGRHVELTVVGHKNGGQCTALDTALAKVRWIPSLAHHDVLKLMREQDVLVFPTLFEGFGLVITEAMAQGTPVITTERSAGPDLIKHGENGWLIEAGSTPALQSAIEDLIINRSLIANAGYAAMQTAKYRPWEVYGMELANAIDQH